MAVAYETSLTPISVSFASAGETETHAFNAGTGADRVLLVFVTWNRKDNDISSVTYNGVGMTSLGANVISGNVAGQLWRLVAPASGSNNIAVTMGAGSGNSAGQISAWVGNGGSGVSGYVSATGGDATASQVSAPGAVTSAVGDMVVSLHATVNATASIAVTTSTGYTERQDAADGGGFSQQFGDAAGAASVTTSATWDNGAFAVSWLAMGVNITAAGGGGGRASKATHTTELGTALGIGLWLNR